MPGGMHVADVRDLAVVHVAVMEPGRGPRAYLATGHYISMPDIVRTLADLSGRRIPFVVFPAWFLAGFGQAMPERAAGAPAASFGLERTWAIESANGLGKLLAQQLLGAGEHVVDVPPTLLARVRLLNRRPSSKRGASRSHSTSRSSMVASRRSRT